MGRPIRLPSRRVQVNKSLQYSFIATEHQPAPQIQPVAPPGQPPLHHQKICPTPPARPRRIRMPFRQIQFHRSFQYSFIATEHKPAPQSQPAPPPATATTSRALPVRQPARTAQPARPCRPLFLIVLHPCLHCKSREIKSAATPTHRRKIARKRAQLKNTPSHPRRNFSSQNRK